MEVHAGARQHVAKTPFYLASLIRKTIDLHPPLKAVDLLEG